MLSESILGDSGELGMLRSRREDMRVTGRDQESVRMSRGDLGVFVG